MPLVRNDRGNVVIGMKKLSAAKIARSPEIEKWLDQFSTVQRPIAESLLLHLRFVSRDEYSEWLRLAVGSIESDASFALFAIRKLDAQEGQVVPYFDAGGNPTFRPPQTLGSEDLVYSLISNIVRGDSSRFLDHPGLDQMREEGVRNVVLIDDSIGSGDRVTSFMRSMMQSKSLLSWWSYGLIRFTIVSYARTREGEKVVVRSMVGSNHPKRIFPKATKIGFKSERVYAGSDLKLRWGKRYEDILHLCESVKKVDRMFRLGYGGIMANLVFHHSVPNNIPGILHRSSQRWTALFPNRSLPEWIIELLEEEGWSAGGSAWEKLSQPMVELLLYVKKGVRNWAVLAQRMGRDEDYIESLVAQAVDLGLISDKGRITISGMDAYYANTRQIKQKAYDYSLYFPSSWCAGW